MTRPRLLAAVLAATLLPAAAAGAAGPPAPVALDAGWQYAPDPVAGVTQPASGWRDVTLPHVMVGQPTDAAFGGGVGWYRTTFTAPAAPAGFGWAVRFGQARRVAEVWLNGTQIGVHSDPYVPFTLPAGALVPGGENTLLVRLDNRKGPEPREGWWNWGGLTRAVTLVPRGPVVLEDPGVLPDVRCAGPDRCTARVRFDGVASNTTESTQRVRVAVGLKPPGGAAAIERSHDAGALAPGASRRVRFSFAVPAPELWSPDDPQLYATTVQTFAGSARAQVDRFDTGLRELRVRDGALVLNGRPLDLRGASIQEDMPGRGPALTDADIDEIVSELKAVGADVTRAHYLLDPRLLDRLDREGILVWEQAPIYHRDVLLRTPNQRARALATLRGTILADRNHPSVIATSVANELSGVPDELTPTGDYLRAALRVVRDLDPMRPAAVDILSRPGYPHQDTYARFDLLGVNNYFGWYPGRPGPQSTARLADLAPYLRRTHAMYPRQALVMTEFGAEATVEGPATRKQTYAFQSDYLRRTLDVVDEMPFMSGAIYWTLREFAVKPHWEGGSGMSGIATDAIHNKGLIAYDGARKPAFAQARQLFEDTPLYRGAAARAVAISGVAGGTPAILIALLLLGVLALLAHNAWCVRDILRAGSGAPPRALPDELASRRAARAA